MIEQCPMTSEEDDLLRITSDLTEFCERDFAEARRGYVMDATQYPTEGMGGGRTHRFEKIINGELVPEGSTGPVTSAGSFEEAARLFGDGFSEYRTAHPGEVLLWRIRPVGYRWPGKEFLEEAQVAGYYIGARLAIVQKSEAAET